MWFFNDRVACWEWELTERTNQWYRGSSINLSDFSVLVLLKNNYAEEWDYVTTKKT